MFAISQAEILSSIALDDKFYRPSCLGQILVPFPSCCFLLKNTIFLTKKRKQDRLAIFPNNKNYCETNKKLFLRMSEGY